MYSPFSIRNTIHNQTEFSTAYQLFMFQIITIHAEGVSDTNCYIRSAELNAEGFTRNNKQQGEYSRP